MSSPCLKPSSLPEPSRREPLLPTSSSPKCVRKEDEQQAGKNDRTSLDDGTPLECPETTFVSSSVQHSLDRWIRHSAWPGLGLFGESYVLFSIGLFKPFWAILFPECWHENDDGSDGSDGNGICSNRLLHSVAYSVVVGVIVGMLGLGYAARQVGRRMGSLTTATLMTMGAWGLALSSLLIDSEHPVALFRCTSLCLFVFGVGVGGEYPLAASSASEVAMGAMQHKLRLELEREERATIAKVAGTGVTGTASAAAVDGLSVIKETEDDGGLDKDPLQRDRGRQIQLVFTMQGMGILVNSLTITFLLLVTGQTGNQYNDRALLFIWRAVYVVGALILSYVLYSRWKHLQESTVWLDDKRRREQLTRHTLQDMTSEGGSGGGGGIAPVTPHVPSPVNSERNDVFRARSRVSSGMSDISSLSCPSVELGDGIIKEVPSTDPEDDLQTHHLRLLWRNYGVRLIGASLAWMLWDVAFYGNKLFQSSFLLALTGEETTLLQLAAAASLNSFVALLGYFGAAAIVDHPRVGRCRLQQVGFLITGSLFVGCGLLYHTLSPAALVVMYLGSSFFGQLGPNATTFLIPAEIFPTEMRTLCHGIAAASGKVGALAAAVMFNHVSSLDMFLLSGYASFAACAVTFWTIPETSGLDLYENDRKWRLIVDGRKGEYDGAANHLQFLSHYERHKLTLQHQLSRNHNDYHHHRAVLDVGF